MSKSIKPFYEERLWSSGFHLIAGVDEAGRGALAGPLVAASVILPKEAGIEGLVDSKLLTEERREELYDEIVECAIAWHVEELGHSDIDDKGLQWANMTALERAVGGLSIEPDFVLSDAFPLDKISYPRLGIIKGDQVCWAIAAASIMAKVTRDRIMIRYADEFPVYGFAKHKGYSTPQHMALLFEHGPCPIHRRSFAPVMEAIVDNRQDPFS